MYAVGPDGRLNSNNPVVDVTPPSTLRYWTNEFFFVTFALILVISGGIMWGVSRPIFDNCMEAINCDYSWEDCAVDCNNLHNALKDSGIPFFAIGVIMLLGFVFFMNDKIQNLQHQIQLQLCQLQINQQQMQQTRV